MQTTRECEYCIYLRAFDPCFAPMTLTLDLDLYIAKTYLRTKTEVSRSRLSKVRARTGQTDAHTDAIERITKPHSRVVIKNGHIPRQCPRSRVYPLGQARRPDCGSQPERLDVWSCRQVRRACEVSFTYSRPVVIRYYYIRPRLTACSAPHTTRVHTLLLKSAGQKSLLLRSAIHSFASAAYYGKSVCPSVRRSATLRYCVKTRECRELQSSTTG